MRCWCAFHLALKRATLGRSCSQATRFFLEGQPFPAHKAPHRVVAGRRAARAEFSGKARKVRSCFSSSLARSQWATAPVMARGRGLPGLPGTRLAPG